MQDVAARRVWEAALGQLQLQVSRPNYQTWLKDTVGVRYDGGILEVTAPSDFATQWLSDKLQPLIVKTVTGIVGEPVQVAFKVARAGGNDTTASQAVSSPSLPAPASARSPQTGLRLNDRYTFRRFVVGDGNRLAHAAALAAAEKPGQVYNPVFIYGGVGLGKTHLLHAIGHRGLETGLSVIYASSEQFTNEFVSAIAAGTLDAFRQKYRNADILLIDDIQFIAGKERTQEEFFHTFNDLHSADKQIILSSDRSPRLLSLLEDRLRSRFEWGLTADIQPPDLETRLAILSTRASEQGITLPDDVAIYIAEHVHENVRELEGCLNRLVAHASLMQMPINLETAVAALASIIGTNSANGTGKRSRHAKGPDDVIGTVADYFSVKRQDLIGPGRDKRLAYARHIAAYLLKEITQLKVTEVARLLGNRDHSTILHAYEKVQASLDRDPQTRRHIIEIRNLLEQY